MCLYSQPILNRKYLPNKKNGGCPPFMADERFRYVHTECGNCMECRTKKRRDWQVRLNEECRGTNKGYFITLTFAPEHLMKIAERKEVQELDGYERENKICQIAIKLFIDRWKKHHKGKSVKHWFVTELGIPKEKKKYRGTEHVHIHGILWTEEEFNEEILSGYWQYGFVHVGDFVSERTMNYVTKYITKQDKVHKAYKPKIICSPKIGDGYFKRGDCERHEFRKEDTRVFYVMRDGKRITMPTYYKNKIWDDWEREQLWGIRLETGERQVCGEKMIVKTVEDEAEFIKLIDWYRAKSGRLGYGTGQIDYKTKQAENKRRNELWAERQAKLNKKKEQLIESLKQQQAYQKRNDKIRANLKEISWSEELNEQKSGSLFDK